jgi:hypothetical protein
MYIYGDYGSGKIFGLRYDGRRVITHTTLFESNRRLTSFGADDQHELYIADHQGDIFKLVRP